MHLTDDYLHRSSPMIARAAAKTTGSGAGKRRPIVAEADPTEAEGVAHLNAHPLDGFTILPTLGADPWADRHEALHEDDGA